MIKRPPNINADEMETNPVNKACITATNDVIVPKSQDSTYSSSLSKRETRHTHLRSNRETRHTRLRSQIAGFDILIFALFARFDILIFALLARLEILVFALNNHEIRYTHLALLSNRKTRHTLLRSHRGIRYTHLRFQMARLGILAFALIREIWRYINLNFAQSQYDDRFEFRFIKMRRY